ncbi:MAG: electron transport complex subunit E [Candidatus Margulisiibacteriota bacterium]|jgi:electron transport complex protein RnfE
MKFFYNILFKDNPVFILMLGLCPTLAITTSVLNGLGMGAAFTFVLIGSNVLVSLMRRFTPPQIRIPVFITIIATFVTITDLLMSAYTPDLHHALGIFIPLIVVNCIILARAEAFASKNNVLASFWDGLQKGIAYTFALLLIGSIREILGSGALLGHSVLGPNYLPMLIMVLPPGAFFVMGLLLAVFPKKNAL